MAMMGQQILIASGKSGLHTLLSAQYDVVAFHVNTLTLTLLQAQLRSGDFTAVYIDDDNLTVQDIVTLSKEAFVTFKVKVLLGVFKPSSEVIATRFKDTGIPVFQHNEPTKIVEWIASQLHIPVRSRSTSQKVLAVAAQKGGVGKTMLTSLLAVALVKRGLQVLVIDGDPSNPGIPSVFALPNTGFRSYLNITTRMTTDNLRSVVTQHPSGVHLLLGAGMGSTEDLVQTVWLAMMATVKGLTEYDLVIIDTAPDIKKRPYPIFVLQEDGHIVIPAPPGKVERNAVANLLGTIQTVLPDSAADVLQRCHIVMMEAEVGSVINASKAQKMIQGLYPSVSILGTLPRDARTISMARELDDHEYVSPLDLAPNSPLTRHTFAIADALARKIGINYPAHSPPQQSASPPTGWKAWMFGSRA